MNGWTAWRFADPWWLLAVVLLLPVVYAALRGRAEARVRFSSVELLRAAEPQGRRAWLRHVPLLLRCAAIFLAVVALARPQGGNVQREVSSEGVDILLAADTSGSMEAMDFTLGGKRVTRLEVAAKVMRDFIGGRMNDRIGLLLFGEEAFIQCPTTVDYGVLVNTLAAAKIGMAGDGTAIGSAIGAAVQSLRELPGRSKIVILLTDGRNNTGILDPVQAARAAATYGIKIYTVGVGTEGKAPFLVQDLLGKRLVYQEVDLDEDTLREVAAATGGRYFRATTSESLEEIYRLIDEMEKTEVKVREFTDYHELYPLLLLPALGLLLVEGVLRSTWLRTLP
jgi:Ca-activated chloride channel family protein